VEASTARPTEEVVSAWAGICWRGQKRKGGEGESWKEEREGGREDERRALEGISAAPERPWFGKRSNFALREMGWWCRE